MQRALIILLLLVFTTGCQQMGTSEYGVIFRKLPPTVGGGVSDSIVTPGKTVFLMPWESLYRFDTSVKSIEWGAKGSADGSENDYVETRALDGNEVSLAVKIQYRIDENPQKLVNLVQNVATSNEEVEELVAAVGRTEIRTHMNKLKTSAFFVNEKKYAGEQEVRQALQDRLAGYGIDVQNVNLKEHRFGESYQKKINEVQTKNEETKRELLLRATIKSQKEKELNDAQGEVNRGVAEAEGYKQQAMLRGDGYYKSKENEATGILAAGKAEVEGMKEQINALAGVGGEAILKLELAKQLQKNNPKFMVLGEGQAGSELQLRKVDTNQLLQQMGIVEALKEPTPVVELTEAPQN